MKKYTLVLKNIWSKGMMPVFSFDVNAQDNRTALLDGEKCVVSYLGAEGYNLINSGMMIGDETVRTLTFTRDGEETDYVLHIIE